MRVFVLGGSGAVGRRLVPMLIAQGHQVVATTRTPARAAGLAALGAQPVIVDGLDRAALAEAVAAARPEVVVHQATAIPAGLDLRHFDRSFALTSRLRSEGTDNLLAAARAAAVPRVIAQSYTGWPNARTGGPVKTEDDPLDPAPPAPMRQALAAIRHLESAVTGTPGIDGVVLRYGSFYGPGTSIGPDDGQVTAMVRRRRLPIVGDGGGIWSFTHIDDAAAATVAALDRGHGLYNVVDDDPAPVAQWLPGLAAALGAKPPRRIPAWLARPLVGELGVAMMTTVRGSANARARRELAWAPRYPSWRTGFRA
jgi:nucleoside-diphosphate-sugar epimerase